MNKTVRAHVVLDEEMVREVDELVGKRHRSEFVSDAIAQKLQQERQMRVLRKFAGKLAAEDAPGWETPASAAAWVRAVRDADNERLDQLWAER